MSDASLEEALDYATKRVEDFTRVHRSDTQAERVDAASTLLKSFGLTDEVLAVFGHWLDDYVVGDPLTEMLTKGGIYIGLLIGLFVKDYDNE